MLAAPRLIVFTDTQRADPELMLARFAELARRAHAGSVLFTLRDYALSMRARWLLGERLALLAQAAGQRLGVADRADLARALGCSAFHLPEAGLTAQDARHYLGSEVFLTRACHDAGSAAEAGLNARVLSPIFGARKGRPAAGLAALQSAAGRGACFALGAVGAGNAAACLAAGASGVAVIGAALAADPAPLLGALGILRV
ncbi:MAG: thiamine phosphate synthase [Polyangiaceae bacterium]